MFFVVWHSFCIRQLLLLYCMTSITMMLRRKNILNFSWSLHRLESLWHLICFVTWGAFLFFFFWGGWGVAFSPFPPYSLYALLINFSFAVSVAEFGIVWGIAVLYRHEELNAEATNEEKGPQNQDTMKGNILQYEGSVTWSVQFCLNFVQELVLYAYIIASLSKV